MNEKEEVLELYKLHSKFASSITSVRQQVNKFYISLLSIIISFATFLGITDLLNNSPLITISFSIFSIILCFVWYININSYKQLNSSKFKMLDELEEKLSIKPYHIEWKYLSSGENKKVYHKLTTVEKYLPVLFSLPFITILIYQIIFCTRG